MATKATQTHFRGIRLSSQEIAIFANDPSVVPILSTTWKATCWCQYSGAKMGGTPDVGGKRPPKHPCLPWIVVIHLLWALGDAFSAPSCLPQRHLSGAYEGIAGMLTIIKVSLLGSALMLLEGCGYLLADLIVQNTISDSLQPDWNPDFKTIGLSWNLQDALDRALDARGYQRVLLTPQSTKRATWSMEEQRWYCCTGAETVGAVP